jgi:adenosylmethionine-8-amino-7-oxononanoate aminotransferase
MTTTHVLHRHLHHTPPRAVAGHGVTLRDASGKEYLDASGGAAVSCLGHGHPDVLAAMHAQIDRLAYAHTSFFTTEVAEELADQLVRTAPEGMSHAYFVSGGSEAVEAALKMARQYFVEIGQPQRRHFIARRQSYHGNTLGALAVGGNAWRRAQFAPLLIDVEHVAPCYPYREQRAEETPEQYGQRLAQELEDTILRLGADSVMAFVAETVGGATAGVLVPVPGYLQAVRRVCDTYGVLLILDEVMCGMGRTGTLHACEQDGVVPDLMTIAKGLGGGYQPIGAVLAQGRIVQGLLPARPYLPGPCRGLRRRAGRAARDRARRAAGARARSGPAPAGPAARRVRCAPARGRHPRARPVLGRGAGAGSRQQGPLRPVAPPACAREGRGVRARLAGLPDGWHGGRPLW